MVSPASTKRATVGHVDESPAGAPLAQTSVAGAAIPAYSDDESRQRSEIIARLSTQELAWACEYADYLATFAGQRPSPLPAHLVKEGPMPPLRSIPPLKTRTELPAWPPDRRDTPIIPSRLPALVNIIDPVAFKRDFRLTSYGRGHRKADGPLEFIGDREWSALLAVVFQDKYPDLQAYAHSWLGMEYTTTDCFACVAAGFQLAHYVQDITPAVASDPTLGDLCGMFEVFMAILYRTELEHRHSSVRAISFVKGIFNEAVFPHLAIDVHYMRCYQRQQANLPLPPPPPVPVLPLDLRILCRHLAWVHPSGTGSQAKMWELMEPFLLNDWRYKGTVGTTASSLVGRGWWFRLRVLRDDKATWHFQKPVSHRKLLLWNTLSPLEAPTADRAVDGTSGSGPPPPGTSTPNRQGGHSQTTTPVSTVAGASFHASPIAGPSHWPTIPSPAPYPPATPHHAHRALTLATSMHSGSPNVAGPSRLAHTPTHSTHSPSSVRHAHRRLASQLRPSSPGSPTPAGPSRSALASPSVSRVLMMESDDRSPSSGRVKRRVEELERAEALEARDRVTKRTRR